MSKYELKQPDIYEKSRGYRYALGTVGKYTLVVFGVNPSTATNREVDRTTARIEKLSRDGPFDSWLILNLYPQVSKKPNQLHKVRRPDIHERNLAKIAEVLGRVSRAEFYAAWGASIKKRKYLHSCLLGICFHCKLRRKHWKMLGVGSKEGHPYHPLSRVQDKEPRRFDLNMYLS